MFASAQDLITAGTQFETVTFNGIEQPIQLRGLTIAEAEKFSELAKKEKDKMMLFSHLVKMCCPAFKAWYWTPKRIRKKLTMPVLLKLADAIMTASGYQDKAVDDAVKN